MVICWILSSMTPDLSSAFLYANFERALWLPERNQILAMDPLPTVNKAYYLLQQLEKQKQLVHVIPDHVAFMMAPGSSSSRGQDRYQGKKDSKKAKIGSNRFFEHCKEEGQLAGQCFEVIGYPDWYKGNRGKKGGKLIAQVNYGNQERQDTPLAEVVAPAVLINPGFVQAVCQDVLRAIKGKGVIDASGHPRGHPSGSSSSFTDGTRRQVR